MKARKVILTAEIFTNLPIAKFRVADGMSLYYAIATREALNYDSSIEVLDLVQLQANAVSSKPKKIKKARNKP